MVRDFEAQARHSGLAERSKGRVPAPVLGARHLKVRPQQDAELAGLHPERDGGVVWLRSGDGFEVGKELRGEGPKGEANFDVRRRQGEHRRTAERQQEAPRFRGSDRRYAVETFGSREKDIYDLA
jgi:hypothetical protein